MKTVILGEKIKELPRILTLVCFILSSFLLLMWLAVPSLKPYWAYMIKVNSAFSIVLASLALYFLISFPSKYLWLSRILSFVVFLVGFLTTIEYSFHFNFGIDEFLSTDYLNEESRSFPGRMSPIAAICFILLGVGLFFMKPSNQPKKGVDITSAFLLPLTILSFFTMVGYLYGEKTFYQVGAYIRISPITSGLLFTLCIAAFVANPTRGPARILLSTGLGGMTARRLLFFVTILPLVLGLLRMKGEELGWYNLQLGISVYAVILVLVLLSMLLYVSNQLDEIYFRELDLKEKEQKASKKIKETADRLAGAVAARDEFLSISSHELKTPLTSLRLQSQLIKRSIYNNTFRKLTDEQMFQSFDQIDKQVTKLNRLIDDMLDITRIRSGKLSINKEKFDLSDLVVETVERIKPMFSEANASLPVVVKKESVVGYWDKIRIEQVLINLLSNALRYGEGNPIEIEVTKNSKMACVMIKDQGIGIGKELLNVIFNRFERAISANEISGLGLGLFIVREIIQAHQGQVWVKSELGQGASFYFEIPLLGDETLTS